MAVVPLWRNEQSGKLDLVPPMERPASEAEAIAWLVDQMPQLRPLLDEHLAFHQELLPYVVFESDLLR